MQELWFLVSVVNLIFKHMLCYIADNCLKNRLEMYIIHKSDRSIQVGYRSDCF